MKLAVTILLVSMMLQTGVQIDLARLKAVVRDRALLAKALLANLVIVPLLGVLVVRAFKLPDEVAAGILLMAIAPGLPLLPRKGGSKVGGSLDFAVVLAFLLPLVSTVTVPLTARLVLPAGYAAQVPMAQFLTTLVVFELLPLVAGVAIASAAPSAAKALSTPLTVVFVLCAVVFAAGAAPSLYKTVASTYGSLGALASLAVVLLAFAAGYALGGPNPAYRNTLAMGTSLRNVGLAALIATASFAGTLVPALVIVFLIVQIAACAVLGAVLKRTAQAPKAGAHDGAASSFFSKG